jgi:hypothetical protein
MVFRAIYAFASAGDGNFGGRRQMEKVGGSFLRCYWLSVRIIHFLNMMRWTKPNGRDLKILVPTAAQVLHQAGVSRENWNLRQCMDIMGQHTNSENLLICLIRNQKAIFEALNGNC